MRLPSASGASKGGNEIELCTRSIIKRVMVESKHKNVVCTISRGNLIQSGLIDCAENSPRAHSLVTQCVNPYVIGCDASADAVGSFLPQAGDSSEALIAKINLNRCIQQPSEIFTRTLNFTLGDGLEKRGILFLAAGFIDGLAGSFSA